MTAQGPSELPTSPAEQPRRLVVAPEDAGTRLDVYLAAHFPEYSRTHLRRVISAGGVTIDAVRRGKPAYRLCGGEEIDVVLPEIPREAPQPEKIPLDVVYEDDFMVAVNKPPAMVVHPSRGHWSGTLAAALQYHYGPSLSSTGGPTRPGIVHRLDRDTSGIIVVARTDQDHARLSAQFAERTVQKEYFAVVAGCPDRDRDRIDQPIGTHPHQREKMAIRHDERVSRPAETFYEVVERFGDSFAALRVQPKTGRTHQIRVHLAHVGCPVLCDRQYGGRSRLTRGELRHSDDDTILLERQALHAHRLMVDHPRSGERMELVAPLPEDICRVLEELRAISQ